VKSQLKQTKQAAEFAFNELGTKNILLCSHLEPKLAAMGCHLSEIGFNVSAISNLPTSFKKECIEPLKSSGVKVFDNSDYDFNDSELWLTKILNENNYDFIFDDGVHTSLKKCPQNPERIISEFTQSGINEINKYKQKLNSTVFNLNSSYTKAVIGNLYGTGISTLSAIQNITNKSFRGLKVGVVGYGPIGKSVAREFKSLGSQVSILEIDKSKIDNKKGLEFLEKNKFLSINELIITCTGNKHVINQEDFKNLKDGVILANVGHYNHEIEIPRDAKKNEIANYIEQIKLADKTSFLLCNGNLVNLMAGKGYPIEVIDYSFAASLYGWVYFCKKKNEVVELYDFPSSLDNEYFSALKSEYIKWEDTVL
jgi:adenosylhomocysteinase